MANGTIAFDTLSTSGQITGTAKSVDTDYVVNGSVKAWMKLIPNTIKDSLNTSSIDDNGTGDFDQNFTNNFSNNNYSTTFGVSAGSIDFFAYYNQLDANITTSYVRTLGYTTSAVHDIDLGTTQILGDLA